VHYGKLYHSNVAANGPAFPQISAAGLNEGLGAGPVPIIFFEKIVTLRDSVIHGDSQVEWKDNGVMRAVADE
jgi:hypothetical protein